MQKKLATMALLTMFLAGLAGAVGILTGGIDLGSNLMYSWADYGAIIGFVAFGGGALLGGRDPGDYEAWEFVVAAVAIATLGVAHLGQPQAALNLLNDYHPWTGIATIGAGIVGFYSVSMR